MEDLFRLFNDCNVTPLLPKPEKRTPEITGTYYAGTYYVYMELFYWRYFCVMIFQSLLLHR